MRVILNPDSKHVDKVRKALEQTGGYCPCAIERTEDTRCMCKEFYAKLEDPEFEGYCHCNLYFKEK